MKNLMILLLVFGSLNMNAQRESFDVQSITMEMSLTEVLTLMPNLTVAGEYYTSDESLGGYSTLFAVMNDNGKVSQIMYVLNKQTSTNKYWHAYQGWKSALTTKYGKPDGEKEIWYRDLYRYDSDKGMAMVLGDFAGRLQWDFEDGTRIILVLSGGDYKCSIALHYISQNEAYKMDNPKSKF